MAAADKIWPVAAATLACLSLLACDVQNEMDVARTATGAAASIGLTPPDVLTQHRMLDPNDLTLDVSVNGRSVTMQPNASGVWEGQINFDPNDSVTVVAAWSAVGATLLPIASLSRSVTVPDDPQGINVALASEQFTTQFDSDGDLRTNIAELRAGTNPRDGGDPAGVAPRLPVKLSFGVPASLQNASDAELNALSLTVLVNDRVFSVTRNGNVWSGESTEVQGNDVFIDAKFFATSARENLVNRYEQRHAMQVNGVFLGINAAQPTE